MDGKRRTSQSLHVTILETIAERENVDEMELPPISEAIDIDALERVVTLPDASQKPSSPEVRFHYAGYDVVVDAAGIVELEPLD